MGGGINEYYGAAYLRNGELKRLSMNNIETEITFGDVVDSLGSPTWVFLTAYIRFPILYNFQLDYPLMGLSFSGSDLIQAEDLADQKAFTILLPRDLSVETVDCYLPDRMEVVLHDYYILSTETTELYMNKRQKWNGFDAYIPMTK